MGKREAATFLRKLRAISPIALQIPGLNSGLASPGSRSLTAEQISALPKSGLAMTLSVFICVHRWLYFGMDTAQAAGKASSMAATFSAGISDCIRCEGPRISPVPFGARSRMHASVAAQTSAGDTLGRTS